MRGHGARARHTCRGIALGIDTIRGPTSGHTLLKCQAVCALAAGPRGEQSAKRNPALEASAVLVCIDFGGTAQDRAAVFACETTAATVRYPDDVEARVAAKPAHHDAGLDVGIAVRETLAMVTQPLNKAI